MTVRAKKPGETPPARDIRASSAGSRVYALGPGLITGASDDDPSGIATYAQAGAQFGYGMCWVMLFTFPLMAAIQEICARIGRVTGAGIAANIRRHHSRRLLRTTVGLLLLANTLNLGADLGAMADAVRIVIGGPAKLYVVGFAVGCAALEIFSRYERYNGILKWTSATLLAYVASAFIVDTPWREVAWNTFVPSFAWSREYIVLLVGVLGTTITPYCFFWQSSQEAEDEQADPAAHPLIETPDEAPKQLARLRFDTWFGMGYSNLVSLFIIVTTAATLHAHGVMDIQTTAQAAEALRPIAGMFTFVLFAVGVVGIGLLAVPVLAGSAAYALGEALEWPTGLARLPLEARAFYGAIATSTLVGVFIDFLDIDPIKALVWAAVFNGVAAVPLMWVIMRIACERAVMGPFVLPMALRVGGWLCFGVMAIAVAIMLAMLAWP